MDERERAIWRNRWRATVWQLSGVDGAWCGLLGEQAAEARPRFALSAWTPDSALLPEAVNRARDALLAAELQAHGERPQRIRGGDPQADWWEEGWLIGHDQARDSALLRRYGQLAGLLLSGGRARLLWRDGRCDPP